jgi:diaminopimelate epimerase
MKREKAREVLFKYHGLGNDFIVLDRREDGRDIDSPTARSWCDRRRGIGADGVLVLLPSDSAAARMVVHNADGSIAEMCGNGIRCAAKYLADGAREKPVAIRLETGAGLLSCALTYKDGAVDLVEVSMGPVRLVAENLPSRTSGTPFVRQELSGFPSVHGTAVSMGNPHLVLFDSSLEDAGRLGPQLERHPAFRQGTNVVFARSLGDGLEVRVWERGVGLTEACGTGACAAVAAGVLEKRLGAVGWVNVALPGGNLQIRCEPDLSNVAMRGPASFVFEASLPDTSDGAACLPTAESSAERTPGISSSSANSSSHSTVRR